ARMGKAAEYLVAASAILGADVGQVLLVGIVFSVIIWLIAGVGLAPVLGRRLDVAIPNILGDARERSDLESAPKVRTIVMLLLLPLVLILLNTALNTVGATRPDPEAFNAGPTVAVLRMLGETPVALLITLFVSMFVLGWGAGKTGTLMEKVQDSALGPIASVVLVTGAGGMFGGVLRATGIGDAVAQSLQDIGMPVIVAAYLIAQIVRLAQGSATVALTTAASLMAGIVAAGDFTPFQVVALVMAMSAGSVGFSHVNDSGFWLVSRFFGMDMKQTLGTWTVLQGAMGVIGFALALILYGVAGGLGM
ncbi:MAG: GntP family permease, partial [Brachybacterium sp.]|nr:GntP family permease [Brachybacterium sp.]